MILRNLLKSTVIALTLLSMPTLAHATDCVDCTDCKATELATALDRLEGLGRLQNCQIELVTRISAKGAKQYMLLANDLTPIALGARPAATFEFETEPSCVDAAPRVVNNRTLRYSYGYSTPQKDYRVAITVQTSQGGFPIRLLIQSIDLASHQVDQRVACGLPPEDL